MNSWLRFLAILGEPILIGSPAAAHPHVWVVLKSQLIYDKAGLVTGVRHVWTFDDVYSTFLISGSQGEKERVVHPRGIGLNRQGEYRLAQRR